jgi:hypothetical protein
VVAERQVAECQSCAALLADLRSLSHITIEVEAWKP